ncbi:MAG: hypothetical protein AAB367_02450 [Patescibacteria group bacterium]
MVDTSCPDTDRACHDARARGDALYDAKSEIADESGAATYVRTYKRTVEQYNNSAGQPALAATDREAYDDMIRNSGRSAPPPTRGGVLLEAE